MNRWLSFVGRVAAPGLLLAVLSACGGGGGGGGGDGGDNPSNPAPSDAANAYFPTDSGLLWTYDNTLQTSFSSFTDGGRTVHSLNYPSGAREYFVTTADQIGLKGLFLHSIATNAGTFTGNILFNDVVPILRSNWTASFTQAVSGKGTIDISPTYGKRDLTYSGTAAYIGDEDISTTVAGFHAKTLMIDLTLTTTVEGQTFSIPYKVTLYVADGAGIVKRKQKTVINLLTSRTGLDADGDGVVGSADKFPTDGNRWQDSLLYASDDGIAFTSLPSHSNLSQTITVMEGRGVSTLPVEAVADRAWLSVAALSGNQFELTANAIGLATDTVHYATVTISPSIAETAPHAPAKVRVALWVGSQDAAADTYVASTGREIVADPVRPYVYVNNSSSIDIYNIYDQTLVGSIPVAFDGHEKLRVSGDGSFLYAGGTALHRIALDAPYDHVETANLNNGIGDLTYARPQGHPVIFDGRGFIFDGATMKAIKGYWFSGQQFDGMPVASVLGNRACLINSGYMSISLPLTCYELAFIDGEKPDLRFKRLGAIDWLYAYSDMAVSNDGSRVYVLPSQSWWIYSYDMNLEAGPLMATASPAGFSSSNLEVGASGNIYMGGMGITVFGPDLIQTGNLGFIAGNMRVSGDEAVILGSDGTNLQFFRRY